MIDAVTKPFFETILKKRVLVCWFENFGFSAYLAGIFFSPFLYFMDRDSLGFQVDPLRVFIVILSFVYMILVVLGSKQVKIPSLFFGFCFYVSLTTVCWIFFEAVAPSALRVIDSNLAVFRLPSTRQISQYFSFVTYVGLTTFLSYQFCDSRERISLAVKTFYYACIVLLYYGFLQWFFSQCFGIELNSLHLWRKEISDIYVSGVRIYRMHSLGGEPKMVGMIFLIGAGLALAKKNFLALFLFILAALLTFSTSVLFALVFVVPILFLFFCFKIKISKLLKVLIPLLFFTSLISYLYFDGLKLVLATRFFGRLKNLMVTDSLSENTFDVLPLLVSIDNMKSASLKFIFGVGYGRSPIEGTELLEKSGLVRGFASFDSRIYILKILSELGLFGLVFYLALFLFTALRNARLTAASCSEFDSETSRLLLFGLFFSFIASSFEVSWYLFFFLGWTLSHNRIMKIEFLKTQRVPN